MLARDTRNPDARPRPLRHNHLLFLRGPAASAFAARDHLEALRASTLMSAPIRALGPLCAVDVHHRG